MRLAPMLRFALAACVIALLPTAGWAAGEGARANVVRIDLKAASGFEQLLGVIVHADGNVVHILAPLTTLMTRKDPTDPTQVHVVVGLERQAVSTPFFQDAALGFGVLTVERRLRAADEAPTMVARKEGSLPATGTAFDLALRATSVDLPRDTSSAATGSPVLDTGDKVLGFIAVDPRGGRRLVAALDVMRVLRTDWQIPANRLVPLRSLRSAPRPLSLQEVGSLMAQPGFRWPRGSLPAVRGALPADLPLMAGEVDRRLREDAGKPARAATPPVDRVSFHKFESRKQGNDTIVIDHATGLTWLVWNAREWRDFCQARIDQLLSFDAANQCIGLLNESRVAGRRDWRMPTLEELASLLSVDAVAQVDGARFHVDPVFGTADGITWSADPLSGTSGMQWGVCFAPDDKLLQCATPKAWPSANPGRLFVVRSGQ